MKKTLMGTTLVAAICLLAGCSNGSTDTIGTIGPKTVNFLDLYTLETVNPPDNDILTAAGLDLTQYNTIKEIAGGYQGWDGDEEHGIEMIWTGRGRGDFDAVYAQLTIYFGIQNNGNPAGEDGWYSAEKKGSSPYYNLMFVERNVTADGLLFPAGLMSVFFQK